MVTATSCRDRVLECLSAFLESTGRRGVVFNDRTHLTRHLGLKSDEGVDFVIDLGVALGFDFPDDFNPFVHSDGRRGRRVNEMVASIESILRTMETSQ